MPPVDRRAPLQPPQRRSPLPRRRGACHAPDGNAGAKGEEALSFRQSMEEGDFDAPVNYTGTTLRKFPSAFGGFCKMYLFW
jgi:hypothetical protein